MSMLAESRRKKKWSVDPQGKRWSKDNEKIGQKMLEKMGWTNGKGLGVNEQGIVEHVRINKRNPEYEKAGIGYGKDSHMKDVHIYQDKFNELLQQLSKHHNQESNEGNLSDQSLELKSKLSHTRLHYQKFTRGKDVSKYNSKDLANIFGKRELTSKTEVNIEEDNNIYDEAVGTKDNYDGVITINRGSMSDYFKQKLPDHKKPLPNNTIDNQATDSKSETEQHVSFEFASKTENTCSINEIPKNFDKKSNYAFDNPCLGMNSPTETPLNVENFSKKSRKKRKEFIPKSADLYIEETNEINIGKKLKIGIIDNNCKNGFINPALNLDMKPNEDCNGKEFEVSRAQFGLENCGLDLTDEERNKKRVTFNDHVEYNIDATKRKKEKATLDKFEIENKKLKKKRKRENAATLSNGIVNEALDVEISSEEINDNELNEHKSTKIKKRKICKTSSLETIQESPEREKDIIKIDLKNVTLDNTENIETDIAFKKSKKKKKNKKEAKIMDNNIASIESEKEDIINEKIIRNKKHKHDKKREGRKEKNKDKEECRIVPNGTLEKLEIEQQHTMSQDLVKIKNKKNRKQEIIVEDLTKDETSPVVTIREESVSLETENTVQKKEKRNKDNHIETEINMCDVEREISDKENAVEQPGSNIKLPKKNKKRKRSKNALDIESSTNPNTDVIDANISNQENIDNVEFISTPLKKNQVIDSINDVTHSPWNKKARMTKKILKRFFYRNLIADFPGSNIQEIKGYGVDTNGN